VCCDRLCFIYRGAARLKLLFTFYSIYDTNYLVADFNSITPHIVPNMINLYGINFRRFQFRAILYDHMVQNDPSTGAYHCYNQTVMLCSSFFFDG